MKTNRLVSLVAAVAILGAVSGAYAAPLGTGFTYQGQLKKAGVPLNGTADFQFTLWDAAGSGNPPTGGTQIGNVQAVNAHPVTAGLFTVALNPTGQFGASAFTGEARWLQIAVRSPAGNGSFTTLSPRQPLTAAPHTLFALNAANSTQLNGQGPSFYQNAANLIAGTLNAARLPNPLTLSGNSTSHIIRGENASAAKGSSGVSGEGTDYGVYGESNNVGVFGEGNDVGVSGVGNNVGVSGRSIGLQAQVGGGDPTKYGGYFESDGPTGRGVYGVVYGLALDVAGGTFSKDARGVHGEANFDSGPAYGVYGESRSSEGYGVYGKATAGFGNAYGGTFWSNSTTRGIGVYGLVSDGDNVGLAHDGKAAALGDNTYGGYFLSYSPSGHGVYGVAPGDGTTYGVRGRVQSPTGYAGYFEGRGYFEGNVGIGTTTPDSALDVNGDISVTASPGNEMVIKNRDVWTHANGPQTFGDGAGAHFVVASKEGVSESAGVYGDGDVLTLWSPGDSISGQPFALMYVLDEDNFDADGNPYNNGALKAYLADTGLWVQSDKRRKKDFASINQACEKISRISAYTFEYIPSPEDVAKGDVPKRVPGLIAQEVEKVLPEAVAINADGEYFMNYSLLVPLLVESVKELNERLAARQAHTEPSVVPSLVESVRELNESLAAKQAHIEALEARLAALEGRLSVLNPAERSSGE